MADFCQQCGPELGDLTKLCPPGKEATAICECCGFIWVDSNGNCLQENCICRQVESGKLNANPCMNPGAHAKQDEPKKLMRHECGAVLDFTGLVKCYRCSKILCTYCYKRFRNRPVCKPCGKEIQREEGL